MEIEATYEKKFFFNTDVFDFVHLNSKEHKNLFISWCYACDGDFMKNELICKTQKCAHACHYMCGVKHYSENVACCHCNEQVLEKPVSLDIPISEIEKAYLEANQKIREASLDFTTPKTKTKSTERKEPFRETVMAHTPQRNRGRTDQRGRVVITRFDFGSGKGKATKKELLKLLQIKFNRYTPPERMVNMDFLKNVLAGRKKLLKIGEVNFIEGVERFRELSIHNLLSLCTGEIPEVFDHLPDNHTASTVDRGYLMNVMNTLQRNVILELRMRAIRRSRMRNGDPDDESHHIELTNEFRDIFHDDLFPLGSGQRLLAKLEKGRRT